MNLHKAQFVFISLFAVHWPAARRTHPGAQLAHPAGQPRPLAQVGGVVRVGEGGEGEVAGDEGVGDRPAVPHQVDQLGAGEGGG